MINISKMSKPAVLVALYNASKPVGWGFLETAPDDMTPGQAKTLLERTSSFDYIQGRVMKVDLSKDTFDPHLYDRDNGQGAAARAIAEIGQ